MFLVQKKRGLLVSLNELGITVGFLLAYIFGFAFISMPEGWYVAMHRIVTGSSRVIVCNCVVLSSAQNVVSTAYITVETGVARGM